MMTIILLKKSEVIKNNICDTIISAFEKNPKLITKNNELKISTNMIFKGINLFNPFNIYLRNLRSQGIIYLMIDLDK